MPKRMNGQHRKSNLDQAGMEACFCLRFQLLLITLGRGSALTLNTVWFRESHPSRFPPMPRAVLSDFGPSSPILLSSVPVILASL